jgi:hypothetical protein
MAIPRQSPRTTRDLGSAEHELKMEMTAYNILLPMVGQTPFVAVVTDT